MAAVNDEHESVGTRTDLLKTERNEHFPLRETYILKV